MRNGNVNYRKKIIETTLTTAIFVFGIWYFCIRILGNQLQYIPGDLGDSRFVNFLLEHGYSWITGKTSSFWNAGFMYPFQNSIALSDPMIGTQLFYFPWRLANFNPETSYQLWWICVCTCNFWVSNWTFNKFLGNKLLAATLAWVFAFSIFNLTQLNYMQMIIRFPVPLAFYSAYQFTTKTSLKYLLIGSLSVVYQFYCVPYTGFYLFYFLLLFIFIFLLISKAFKQRFLGYLQKSTILKTIIIASCSATLLLILLIPYAYMSKTVGLRLYHEVVPNLPTLKSYLSPHPSSVSYNMLNNVSHIENEKWWVSSVFIGFSLTGTLIFSIVYLSFQLINKNKINTLLKSLIITSVLISIVHLRIGDSFSAYGLIFKLPGINSIRVPSRFMHVELFFLLLAFGIFVSKQNFKYIFLILILFIVDNSFDASKIQRENKAKLIERKEKLIVEIKKHKSNMNQKLALVDTLNPAFVSHIDAMLASQALGINTINGYSSYCPDPFGEYFKNCSTNGLTKWMKNQKLESKDILIIKRTNK